ncbi:glycosyltransferase [Murdochiella sp. Marseille-P8839]|nr:glycosyltransferase [Murdochiella sp. Marseille-P8839]
MKVLLTSDLNPDTVNGVIVSVLMLKQELERQGCEVKLLTLSSTRETYREGEIYYVGSIPLDAIYPDLRASLNTRSALVDELIAWKPDIIHSQCEFFTYSFVQRIAKHCHCPIIHTYHTQYEYYTKYVLPGNWDGFLARVMALRLRSADVVIAPTEKTKNYLLSENICSSVRVIPTGIDLEAFSRAGTPEEMAVLRKKLGVPSSWRLYGNVGRVAQEKNLDEVLAIHQRVREQRDDVGLLIVGDGAGMKQLKKQIEERALGESVFLTGMVPKETVGSYYQLLDFFISASVSETQGLTYIEALANGRPVIARRDDAIAHVVQSDVNGYQYDTTDECVNILLQLLADDALYARWKQGAWESRDQFSKKHFGERVFALYQEQLRVAEENKG